MGVPSRVNGVVQMHATDFLEKENDYNAQLFALISLLSDVLPTAEVKGSRPGIEHLIARGKLLQKHSAESRGFSSDSPSHEKSN